MTSDDQPGKKHRPALRLGQWVRVPFHHQPWMVVDFDDESLTLAQRSGKEITIAKPRSWKRNQKD